MLSAKYTVIMKKRILPLIVICVVASAKAQQPLSLQQCVETAISNNLDVRQRELQMQSSEANWKQARMNRLPDLNASAGHSFNQGRSIDPFTNSPVTQSFNSSNYGISSGVILFNGLSIHHNIRQNKLSYEASKMDWQQEKDNVTINVILAYLQVLSSNDQLVQAQNQAALSLKQVERLQVLDAEGAIKPSDLADLKGQYAGDQVAIISAQNALESARITLCQWMNIPYDKNMTVEKLDAASFAARYEENPGSIFQTALKNLALIKAADLRAAGAESGIKAAKGQLYPVLRFGGNVYTSYSSVAMQSIYQNTTEVASADYVLVNGNPSPVYKQRDNFSTSKINYSDQLNNNLYTSFGFNLSIPLFNAWQQRNRIKQAQIQFKSQQLVASATRTQLGQAIDQAYVNMTTASDRYAALLEQVKAYEESFRAAGIRFQEGVGNSIDYLTAKNNLDRSNVNLIIAKYDYVLRSKILDYYQGRQLW